MANKQLAPKEVSSAKNQSESLRKDNAPGRAGMPPNQQKDIPATSRKEFPDSNNILSNSAEDGNTWNHGAGENGNTLPAEKSADSNGDNPGTFNNNGVGEDDAHHKAGEPDTTSILTDRLMTYQDLSRFTQIPLPTLKAKKDLIPHFKFGKAVRFYKPDIILWLQTKHMVRPIEIDTRPTSKDHILREVQQGKEVV